MKQSIKLIFVAALFCFFGVFFSYLFTPKKNSNQKEAPVNSVAIIDSMKKQQYKVEEKAKKDSTKLSKQIDSVSAKYKEVKASLNEQRKKNIKLADAVKNAELLNDTSSYFEYCNGLSAEVRILDNRITEYQKEEEELKSKNDSLLRLMSSRIGQWQNSYGLLGVQAEKNAYKIDSLTTKNNELIRKANRKYNVSIGVLGGVTNSGFGGGVGIVVGRTVWAF